MPMEGPRILMASSGHHFFPNTISEDLRDDVWEWVLTEDRHADLRSLCLQSRREVRLLWKRDVVKTENWGQSQFLWKGNSWLGQTGCECEGCGMDKSIEFAQSLHREDKKGRQNRWAEPRAPVPHYVTSKCRVWGTAPCKINTTNQPTKPKPMGASENENRLDLGSYYSCLYTQKCLRKKICRPL